MILLLLSTAAVITPWSERNARLFGTRAITDRGGEVLLLRAYEDQVSPDEYRGVWCVYAPSRLRPSICRLTGWTGADLQPGAGPGPASAARRTAAGSRGWGWPRPSPCCVAGTIWRCSCSPR